MSSIKFRFFKSCNSLILLLISMIGFTTSCKEENDRYEYGAPVNNFILMSGKVLSAKDHQPVPEIIVEAREVVAEGEVNSLHSTSFSYFDGHYTIPLTKHKTFQLRFVDTDGPQNGEYETLDTLVVTNLDHSPKDVMNPDGILIRTLDIQLKPKE